MQLNITFRHFDSSDALREHAKEKVERANKYLDRAGEAHVVLSLERHLHQADITINAGTFVLRGKEKTEDMYASIDLAMDKIERQLRRYKEKLKHHHGKDRVHHREGALHSLKIRHNVVEVLQPESTTIERDDLPRIIKSNEFVAQPMKVEDAVMRMDLMNNDFLVFQNAATHEVNVVYRRKDGHYGLIEAGSHAAKP